MIVRKTVNAAELLWDSLDQGEKLVVLYALAWVACVALVAVQRRSRERFRRELLADVEARAADGRA